jgi:hypothetical protein
MSEKEMLNQLTVDVKEALTKYGGTVEVRRPGHPLFERKASVSRVHLVYDGKGLKQDAQGTLVEQSKTLNVELHFHEPR